MTTKKIYGPWIKWDGGECPVPPETMVKVKGRKLALGRGGRAGGYYWHHGGGDDDIVEYCAVIEQPDLEAAEKLLRENGYTVTPPAKPLTFEDVTPLTEAPRKGAKCWAVNNAAEDGVYGFEWSAREYEYLLVKRRLAYLEREHAVIAAEHIFGLKGGEL